jgi:ubiquinone/menaquinone biosynthesis C-methylase UbiE
MNGITDNSNILSRSVYQILGGRAMDRLLVKTSLELVGKLIPGSYMLDNGVGVGVNTLEYWRKGPARLVATDFQQGTLDMAQAFWRTKNENPDGVEWLLHDASTPLPDDLGSFDLIKHSSVAMHLDPNCSRASIQNQAAHLKVGGVMQFSVVSTDFARKCFIPVPGSDGL